MASDDRADKAPFSEQIRSFSGVYWVANWMELVERFAYYGVRVVLPVYMVLAISEGGPELDHVQKGTIYALWAVVQSFLPIFTGGFADRYGYKLNIAIATVLKIIGYLVMGYCVPIAEALDGMPLAEARELGEDSVYAVFFGGAMLLAGGTAIFKPGLQGLIANQMPKKSAALGWGLFYQMVNIGGFLGPLLAGYLRVLDWSHVFLACTIGICLNFVPLFFFQEPTRARGAEEDDDESEEGGVLEVIQDAIYGLLEPRLFFFTMCFAGFWLMFYQLFDILPNFIDDWIDARAVATDLQGILGESAVPVTDEGNMTQEWMINVNALMISLLAFAFGYLTGFMRSLQAIVIGIAISAVAIFGLGMSMSGYWILGAIALFSVGEMLASPTKMRYLAGIAPPGKEGLYMGYVNMTVGIGWSTGSVIAGDMYQREGDKVELARRYLVEHEGLDAELVEEIDRADVIGQLAERLDAGGWEIREILWQEYEPYRMWMVFTAIGVGSLLLLVVYDRIVRAAEANPEHSFNTKGNVWVRAGLVPIVLGFAIAFYNSGGDVAVGFLTTLFGLLFVASFFPRKKRRRGPPDGGDDDEGGEPDREGTPSTF